MWGNGYGISLQRSAKLAETACGLDAPARMEAGSRVGPATIRLAIVDCGRACCRARGAAAIGDAGRAGGTTALASAPPTSTHG